MPKSRYSDYIGVSVTPEMKRQLREVLADMQPTSFNMSDLVRIAVADYIIRHKLDSKAAQKPSHDVAPVKGGSTRMRIVHRASV